MAKRQRTKKDMFSKSRDLNVDVVKVPISIVFVTFNHEQHQLSRIE